MTGTPKDFPDGVRVWEVTWAGTPGLAWAAVRLRLGDEPCFVEDGNGKAKG